MNKSDGQSLVEVIVALAIAALVAVGLVKATSFGIKNTRFSSNQSQLKSIAQKKINEIVFEAKQNPLEFWAAFPPPSTSEFNDTDDYCWTTKVTDATDSDGRKAKIEVEIFWESKGEITGCNSASYNHSFKLTTYVAE